MDKSLFFQSAEQWTLIAELWLPPRFSDDGRIVTFPDKFVCSKNHLYTIPYFTTQYFLSAARRASDIGMTIPPPSSY
jgi:hypothetical protein